ncbi:MAG: hypothetical protein ACI8R4_002034 [Paracoccaceae bacterium]|jgi:hypothetical protein
MTAQDLYKSVESLEQKIAAANCEGRLKLQPEFSQFLARMQAQGQNVPARLLRLDAALCQEVVEARFDNMPV